MTLNVSEIMAALPEAAEHETSEPDALRQLVETLASKRLPTGAVHRLWTLGTLQAKIAVAYLVYWIRSSYRTADERERLLNETHLQAAIKLLGGMSYLRGAFMKVGQTLANYPTWAPPEFINTLSHLNFEAPPMHFSLLREQVRAELGGEVEEVFAEFDTTAFAAASLGQVHRARLHSGAPVAVKVQYPGIADAIRSDSRNLLALLTPMRLSADWDNLRAQLDDVRKTVEIETDYCREAEFLKRGRSVFKPEDGIVVPKVMDELSTKRVLTMEFLEGDLLDRYLMTNPVQEERDRYGGLIMRASFRIAHAAKLWYADAHPGNYVFMRDGRLGLIDFGCCREFSADEWDYYRQVWKAYMVDDGVGVREAVIRAADLDPTKPFDEEHVRFLTEYSHWWSDYLRYDQPFDFGDDAVVQRGIEFLTDIPKKRYFRSMPVNTWITRQLLGLRGMLYRLKARVNMRRLGQEEEWNILGVHGAS